MYKSIARYIQLIHNRIIRRDGYSYRMRGIRCETLELEYILKGGALPPRFYIPEHIICRTQ